MNKLVHQGSQFELDIMLGVVGVEMEVYTFVFTDQFTKGRYVQRKAKDPKLNPEEPQTGVFFKSDKVEPILRD